MIVRETGPQNAAPTNAWGDRAFWNRAVGPQDAAPTNASDHRVFRNRAIGPQDAAPTGNRQNHGGLCHKNCRAQMPSRSTPLRRNRVRRKSGMAENKRAGAPGSYKINGGSVPILSGHATAYRCLLAPRQHRTGSLPGNPKKITEQTHFKGNEAPMGSRK